MWDKRDGYADGTEQRLLVPPTTTIEGKMVFHYGDSPVEVVHPGPAHTYGDLMIYLPKYRVLFASDVAFIYVAPFAHNAHVGKWLDTVDRIMKMDVETIVPGHGPICGKKELAEMAEYFRALQREVKRRFDAGLSPGRAAADIKLGKFDNWIGPERIVMNTVPMTAIIPSSGCFFRIAGLVANYLFFMYYFQIACGLVCGNGMCCHPE